MSEKLQWATVKCCFDVNGAAVMSEVFAKWFQFQMCLAWFILAWKCYYLPNQSFLHATQSMWTDVQDMNESLKSKVEEKSSCKKQFCGVHLSNLWFILCFLHSVSTTPAACRDTFSQNFTRGPDVLVNVALWGSISAKLNVWVFATVVSLLLTEHLTKHTAGGDEGGK